MPNTDITYFHSEQDSLSILPLHQTETDTFEIYMPAGRFLPSTQLEHNKDLFGNVLFTVGFLIIFAFVRLRGKDLFYNLLNTLLKRKKAEIILNEGISSNLICYIHPYVCPSPSFLSVSSISSKEILSIYLHYIFSSAYFFIIFFFS